jgi:hypothetical protein
MRDKPKKGFDQRQREFWKTLVDYIRQNNGAVVSSPNDVDYIRFEILPEFSTLSELLRSRGYDVVNVGTAEKLMPITNTVKQAGGVTTITQQGMVPTVVDVYEFRIYF